MPWVLETAVSAATETLVLNFLLRTGHSNVLSQINCPHMKPTQSQMFPPYHGHKKQMVVSIVSFMMLHHRLLHKQLKVWRAISLGLEYFNI